MSLLKGVEAEGLAAAEALTAFCEANRLARLTLDEGLGPETRYEPVPATVTLSGARRAVPAWRLPPGDRATARRRWSRAFARRSAGAGAVADLFAGLGTFALALEGRVYAAEASRDAVLALKGASALAGRLIAVEHRDLYRRPLTAKELANFDAVVLDPPRAGAVEQIAQLAASAVPRDRLCQLQPGDLRARRGNAGRRRLPARLGPAGRPVPLVDPCRAGRLLQPLEQSAIVKDLQPGVDRQADQAQRGAARTAGSR